MQGDLSEQELAVIDKSAAVWNAFLDLPIEHPDDLLEFRQAVHALQRIVLCRPARRALNNKGAV